MNFHKQGGNVTVGLRLTCLIHPLSSSLLTGHCWLCGCSQEPTQLLFLIIKNEILIIVSIAINSVETGYSQNGEAVNESIAFRGDKGLVGDQW